MSEGASSKNDQRRKIIEASTWIIMVAIIFGVRFLPSNPIGESRSYYLIGAIVSIALLYYLVIYKYFNRAGRHYFKDIADIILIGVLVHILKDYGQFFFALYFLPIAAAALSMEFISALLIAAVASLFVAFEIFLGSQNLLPSSNELYQGAWQVGLILFITIFCRSLASQLKHEKSAKEESESREKLLLEEAKRQREFLSLASHQLLTPLSMIRGYSSMLADSSMGKLNDKQKDTAAEIHSNSIRMVRLVTELLSISRIQSGVFNIDRKAIQLEDLVETIVDEFHNQNHSAANLVFLRPHQKSEKILADADRIRDVVTNLIDNALKYAPKGTIEVSTRPGIENVEVSIKDQGPGINQEDAGKLFQPFFRGKKMYELDNKGTGLGLYISRLIVERHGGKIWAKNNPSGGAIFAFRLPVKSQDLT